MVIFTIYSHSGIITIMSKRKTTEQFIIDAWCMHGDKYNYKLVEYKNNKTKVKIICSAHGVFEQRPDAHLQMKECIKCKYKKLSKSLSMNINQFIDKAKLIHGDKYDYSLVEYKNNYTKVKIICPVHGVFEQTPKDHLRGQGCKLCFNSYKSNNIPRYNTYKPQLQPYGIECRRNKEDGNILEVKCMYCGRWYVPTYQDVRSKIKCIDGNLSGESNLYCSDECKKACPTYRQKIYPKDFKLNTSREVQPALRKLVLKRDNYTCQKCDATNEELHCHHYEGIEVNPVESADMDMCITLCKDCHNEIHKSDKCGMKDYKKGKC